MASAVHFLVKAVKRLTYTKVCDLYAVTLLNWTPTFKGCMARLLLEVNTNKTCVTMRLDYVLKI